MRTVRVASRIVTGLYILSLVCLLLAAAAWREMVGVATYAFFIMATVGGLMRSNGAAAAPGVTTL
jgi:hypothetical protein